MAKVTAMDGVVRALVRQSEKELKDRLEDALVQEFMAQAEATIRPRVRELMKTITVKNLEILHNVQTMRDELTVNININGETEDKS